MKRPTTKGDPAAAVRDAVAAMRADWGIDPASIARFVHGSTVATNAVIESDAGLVASSCAVACWPLEVAQTVE